MNIGYKGLFFALLLTAFLAAQSGLAAQTNPPCPENSPDREILAKAIQNGDAGFVLQYLDGGGDVNETWRDTPYQVCRSLLLRSIWYRQDDIFHMLLERGVDTAGVQDFFKIPVRAGKIDIVRTLLRLGIAPESDSDIIQAAFESGNIEMLDLLLLWGVTIKPMELSMYLLTDEITRFLVPVHLDPNEHAYVGTESCQVYELFDLLNGKHHYCEGAIGPVWIHFVLTGNHETVKYLIESGADVQAEAILPIAFTGLDAAKALSDDQMINLLLNYSID